MRDATLPLAHFEQIYARGSDPWNFATSAYELDKYAETLRALPRDRYGKALEIGCSIGVLTAMLAGRCDDLLAVEPVERALAAARERNAPKPWVRFDSLFVPETWPNETFDLILLSEVLDYLGTADIEALAGRLDASLRPAGDVVLVHWIGKKLGSDATPEESSERLITASRRFLRIVHQQRNAAYRLDVLQRRAEPL